MLIFDQLKKHDPHLRVVGLLVFGGLLTLLAGLWWAQIVSSRDYQANLEMQSFRTVRVPAMRGKIVDRNGQVLAENRPDYHISLYLEELSKAFDSANSKSVAATKARLKADQETEEKRLGRKLNREERKRYLLTTVERNRLRQAAREQVASNTLAQLSRQMRLAQPLSLDVTNFERHYRERLALPYPVLQNLTPSQIALFAEQCANVPGVDLELESTRHYPWQTVGAHIIGCLKRDDSSAEGEDAFFSYRLPDHRGLIGIEAGYDRELRGKAGAKSVLVNSFGYRQTDNVWTPAEAGTNVVLTIDARLQMEVERCLVSFGPFGAATHGAAVVMDVNSGDILAMASAPTYDPNIYIQGVTTAEAQRLSDANIRPQRNRATQDIYEPGSIFKPMIGLAALESGLDPNALYTVAANPRLRDRGCIVVGGRTIIDLASPGEYDFKRALKKSSNSYFITNGLRAGIENIVRLAQRLHLGETTGLKTYQESAGIFPDQKKISSGWFDGDTANICIGQGRMAVTPLQMTVMTAAIANGGKVLWPRLVSRLEPQDPSVVQPAVTFPAGRIRDELGVSAHNLRILQEAMYADVQDADGTGKAAAVEGMNICGKTGTAQVSNTQNKVVDHTTWFISFAPLEKPTYAVVVMVEGGSSGGGDCAPIAKNIYRFLKKLEGTKPTGPTALSRNTN
jgi:penicillin-binding protein 2